MCQFTRLILQDRSGRLTGNIFCILVSVINLSGADADMVHLQVADRTLRGEHVFCIMQSEQTETFSSINTQWPGMKMKKGT